MLMDLDDVEARIIALHRREKAARAAKRAEQILCTHEVRTYAGHSHNDDAYQCNQCGHIEWR